MIDNRPPANPLVQLVVDAAARAEAGMDLPAIFRLALAAGSPRS
jgi:hypothetical protein